VAPYPLKRSLLSKRFEGTGYIHVVPKNSTLPTGCLSNDGKWHSNTTACEVFNGDPQGEEYASDYGITTTSTEEPCNFLNGTLTCSDKADQLVTLFMDYSGSCNVTISWEYWPGNNSADGPVYHEFYVGAIPKNGSTNAIHLKPLGKAIKVTLVWISIKDLTGNPVPCE